jgi:hypothetical protein
MRIYVIYLISVVLSLYISMSITFSQPSSMTPTGYGDLYLSRVVVFSDISIRDVVVVNRTTIAAIGVGNGYGVLRIVSLTSSLDTYSYRDYLLSGSPTSISTDGSSVIVGASNGEVLILDLPSESRYYFATRGSVKSTHIFGGIAYAADDSFIYVYRYGSQGWAEIGVFRSTAIFYSAAYASIVHIASLDAGKIMIIAKPRRVEVFFDISDGSRPVHGALITMSYAREPSITVSSYTSPDGSARIEAPLLETPYTQYILRITHPSYQTYVANISLGDNPITVSVILNRGQGEIASPANASISFASILDVSGAPSQIQVLSAISIPDEAFWGGIISSGDRYLLMIQTYQGVYIYVLGKDFKQISQTFYYYPSSVRAYLLQGSLLVISNKIYLISDDGKLLSSYAIDSDAIYASSYGNAAGVVSSRGFLHVISTRDLNPLIRRDIAPHYGSGFIGVAMGSISAAFTINSIMLFDQSVLPRIDIIKIAFRNEWNVSFNGTIYVSEDGRIVASSKIENSEATLYIPMGTYDLNISSPQLGSYILRQFLGRNNAVDIPSARLAISLVDRISGKPASDLYVSISAWNRTITTLYKDNLSIGVLIGFYNISIAPADTKIYDPVSILISVKGDTNVSITLERKIYNISFDVVDQYGYSVQGYRAIVRSVENSSIVYTASDRLSIPYGVYIVTVTHPDLLDTSAQILVDGSKTIRVVAMNRMSIVNISAVDSITKDRINIFSLTLSYPGLFSPLSVNTSNGSITAMVPKGYRFSASIYVPGQIYTGVTRNFVASNDTMQISIDVPRAKYMLNIKVVDDTGKPVSGTFSAASSFTSYFDVISDGSLSASLYAGTYKIEISSPGFEKYVDEKTLTKDTDYAVSLRPTPLTLLQRYSQLYIFALVAVSLMLIARYVEKTVRARLAREEKLF